MNVKTLVEQFEDLRTLPCCATYPKTSTTTGKLQSYQRKIVAVGNINTKKINGGAM